MKTNSNQRFLGRMIPLIAIAALLALTICSRVDARQVQGDIAWHSDVEKAMEIAKKQNKLVLLHFDATWCRPCKALETYVFKSSQVRNSIAENVIPVKLDADRALDMVAEYDVSVVPFDVIVTPSGRVVAERRSPADANNYAKMISDTANANRMLKKEKMGPIAHQQQVITNDLISNQDPMSFRADGPEQVEIGLSKDSSLLQRRQAAHTNGSNEIPQTLVNPFMSSAASKNEGDQVAVEDLQRKQFLAKDRNWVAPSAETRRAEPKRIVNDRYFESIAAKNNDSVQRTDVMTPSHGLGDISSANGDFKIPPSKPNLGSVVKINADDGSAVELATNAPEIDRKKLCLKGKCPVTLIAEGRWEDGDTRFGIVHRNRTYIFASAEKLAQFRTNPDNYSPILAGYDPVVYREQGKLIEGLVENGVFMGRTPNQKVILFRNAQTRAKFQASPKAFLETIRQATDNASGHSVMR